MPGRNTPQAEDRAEFNAVRKEGFCRLKDTTAGNQAEKTVEEGLMESKMRTIKENTLKPCLGAEEK